MIIPKAKRRTIIVDDVKYEYFVQNKPKTTERNSISANVMLYARNLTTGEEIKRKWYPETDKAVSLQRHHVCEILKGNYPNIYAESGVEFNTLCPECGIKLYSTQNCNLEESINAVGNCPECNTVLIVKENGINFYSE